MITRLISFFVCLATDVGMNIRNATQIIIEALKDDERSLYGVDMFSYTRCIFTIFTVLHVFFLPFFGTLSQ